MAADLPPRPGAASRSQALLGRSGVEIAKAFPARTAIGCVDQGMRHQPTSHPAPRPVSDPASSLPAVARGHARWAAVVALTAVLAGGGCATRYAVPTGMVVGGASMGWTGSQLAEDSRRGWAVGAISGVLLGAGIGLAVGTYHELTKAGATYNQD
ncbi:MAG: hypothetical protein KA297_16585 [Kofleriaceae bacterium]|nr:hypothetical protein [Kofleriaceae bacterium]